MELETRHVRTGDGYALLNLYHEIAKSPGAFTRAVDEVTPEYIQEMLEVTVADGLGIVALDPDDAQKLIGVIVARRLGPKVFDHVLSELTIGVDPSFQRKGVGRRLLLDFLESITDQRPDILRVEMMVRESDQHAIEFYESLGFRREGVFEKRIRRPDGEYEADVPMAWVRAEY